MPRQQTFDGPELDAVLSRVRKEAGAEARIISASKVRKGGVGGFFSKETFRVTVELTDPEPAAAPPPAPPTLAFEAADPEQFEQVTPPPSSLLELADLIDEAELDAVSVQAPPPAAPPPPPPPPAARLEPQPPVAPAVPVFRPEPYVPMTERPSFNAVLRRLTSEADLPSEEPRVHLPETLAPPTILARPSVGSGVRLPSMPMATNEIDSLLAALGIPDTFLPTELSPSAAVIAMLHSLRIPEPPTPCTDDGALTVVVGERKAATALAHELAGELGLKRTDVKVADPASKAKTGLHDPSQVAEVRAGWGSGPKLVAVAAPLARTGLGWAWETLAALEADALWGVVGADRKGEDVDAWSAALGGFDALAITDLEQTVSPAALLDLGIPIARLDGRPATPSAWAALLTSRLAA